MKELIEKWAADRNIDQYENRIQQCLKLTEEVGELSGAILKHKPEEIIDAIGDIQLVLIILCKQLGINYDRCLQIAWHTIKDRTGKTINGSFVRDVEPENK